MLSQQIQLKEMEELEKARKKRKKRDSDESSDEDGSGPLFQQAPSHLGGFRIQVTAAQRPGTLYEAGMQVIHELLDEMATQVRIRRSSMTSSRQSRTSTTGG